LSSRPDSLGITTSKLLLDDEVLAYVYRDAVSDYGRSWLDSYVEFRPLIADLRELEPEITSIGHDSGHLWNDALPGDPVYIKLTPQERRTLRAQRNPAQP
jgi:hypothetical protein